MIETDGLNNNLEMKPSGLLMKEYLEIRESTWERYIHKAAGSKMRSDFLCESITSARKQVINIYLIVGGWI